VENYPQNAVINYTGAETPFTRIIEHKHFRWKKFQLFKKYQELDKNKIKLSLA
jgi:UDP-galactopyranose mutase